MVSVGSMALRFIAPLMIAMTRPISQRPTIQKAMAASTLTARSATVVLKKFCIDCMSMAGIRMGVGGALTARRAKA